MFVRIETVNRFVPFWRSISYINPANVLRVEVENRKLDIFTVFRPKIAAYTIHFTSQEDAEDFAKKMFIAQSSKRIVNKSSKVLPHDQASPDPLAMQAMADWEEENKKQLK
jgi:hypothetical protein